MNTTDVLKPIDIITPATSDPTMDPARPAPLAQLTPVARKAAG